MNLPSGAVRAEIAWVGRRQVQTDVHQRGAWNGCTFTFQIANYRVTQWDHVHLSIIPEMSTPRISNDPFEDVFRANAEYVREFKSSDLTGEAREGLAIVTCMDSRIDPLRIVGMRAGDAKILRNAGARVTEDVLRTLLLAVHLLGVNRVLVMPHTDCRMVSGTEEEIHQAIWESAGVDTRSFEIRTVRDQRTTLSTDVTRIRAFPLMPKALVVSGAIYDVHTGQLTQIVEEDFQDRTADEN